MYRQGVVARLPFKKPVAPSTNTPEQIEASRAARMSFDESTDQILRRRLIWIPRAANGDESFASSLATS